MKIKDCFGVNWLPMYTCSYVQIIIGEIWVSRNYNLCGPILQSNFKLECMLLRKLKNIFTYSNELKTENVIYIVRVMYRHKYILLSHKREALYIKIQKPILNNTCINMVHNFCSMCFNYN